MKYGSDAKGLKYSGEDLIQVCVHVHNEIGYGPTRQGLLG